MTIPKTLLCLAVLWVPLLSPGKDGRAIHSSFTIEQVIDHLGLKGGNWSVEFGEACFLGFMITETGSKGIVKRKIYWSSKTAKAHQFHFLHHISSSSETENTHELEFSSMQMDEWKEESAVRWKVSSGSGLTYNVSLPQAGEQQEMDGDMQLKINEPMLLFSWGGTETQRAFGLHVLAARNKEEAEELFGVSE
ncbi:MAG: hypothetical protein AAGH89_02615 [Verrucomicrobiota bacterium]